MRFRPTIVVVAAGQGRRFGGGTHKLEQPFAGSTVLGSTLRHAIETQLPVLVVTTAPFAAMAGGMLATRDIIVLTPDQARRGMGATIASGVSERAQAVGWLVLPGDMPLVRPASILAVARSLEQHPVAFAQHKGRRGHPVGFAAELYSELAELTDDDGARRVVARYPAHAVELDDVGVLLDVDTPEDLQRLQQAERPPAPHS
jgi:molybdenum cofactor cytidylyltransferase